MSNYIGKISALVTASTADLERKLNGSAESVKRFGRSLSSTINAAARSSENSLGGIFTRIQNLQRALTAGSGNANRRLRLVDPSDIAKVQRAFQVAEDINKPLASAARQFQTLSRTVAAEFQPALVRSQNQVLQLNNQLQDLGTFSERGFNKVRNSVERTTIAINQLSEAQSRVRSLASGNELEFSDPRLAANLTAARRAGQQALTLPASTIASDPQIEGLVRQIARVSELSVAAAARVKAALTPAELATARQEADRLNEVLERLTAKLDARYKLEIDTAAAEEKAERLRKSLEAANRSIQVLDSSGGDADLRSAEDADAKSRIAEQRAEEQRRQRAREAELRARVGERSALGNRYVYYAERLQDQGRRRVRGLTGDVNIDSTPGPDGFSAQAQRDIDALATRVGAVRQQLETLPNSVRTQFVPALQRAQAILVRLQNSPRATAEEIERAAAAVRVLETSASRAAKALQLSSFRDFTEDLNTRRAVGELEALQQVLVQVGATAGGPAAQAYERYRARLQEAITTGTTGLPRVRKELVALQTEAAKAAAATGKISFSVALRSIQRGGDIARGAFGNIGLAAQQAAFAVEDFFSVTGGLDQRLRAAGNNVSQLAFLLGGTTGLFVGIGAVLAAQVIPPLVRWVLQTDKAEREQEQLEAAIKAVNAALERQKQLTESIAQAYRSLGQSIADSGLSEGGRSQRGRDRQIEDIQREQRNRRREIAVSVNPALSGQAARAAQIEEQLQTETDRTKRRLLGAELRDIRRRTESDLERIELGSRAEIDAASRDARKFGGTTMGSLIDRRQGIQSRLDSLFRSREMLASEGNPTNRIDNDIDKLSFILAQLEVAIQTLQDKEGVGALETAQKAAGVLGRTQQDVEGVQGFTRAGRAADVISKELEMVFQNLADGLIDTTTAQGFVESFSGLAEAANRASIITGVFSDAMEQAAGDLARTVESELNSEAGSLRRRANAAEASRPDSNESSLLRNAQSRIEAATQAAQGARRNIEEQIDRRRGELESRLEAGIGSQRALGLARRIQAAEADVADESLNPVARDQAQATVDRLRAELRALLDGDAEIQGLRDKADEVDIQAQRERQQVESAIRGRELSLTPGQRAGEDLASRLEDIRQYYKQIAEANDEFVDFDAQDAAQKRLINESLRSAAPAIFGLADQVANAVLQGPSRAALDAADVSTVEGARELNRLLRGDDSARDQNLVELQKQSTILEDMLQELRQGGVPVAN